MDAGLPSTAALTRDLDKRLHDGPAIDLLTAYRYVVGGLIWGSSRSGGNPFEPPDIEAVVAAVRLLGTREALEVSPFVTWDPSLSTLGTRRPDPFVDSKVKRALEKILDREHSGGGWRGSSDLARIIREAAGPGQRVETFTYLEDRLVTLLGEILWLNNPSDVEYLAPLLDRGAIAAIATLNYDNAVELCADFHAVPLTTGVASGPAHAPLNFEADALKLLKLHGSVNWFMESRVRTDFTARYLHVAKEPGRDSLPDNLEPALVFGAGTKLRADGPFLKLLQAFSDHLSTVDELVVVGYSFRDPHVNTVIEEWIQDSEERHMVVVNPNEFTQDWGLSSFPAQVASAISRGSPKVRHVRSPAQKVLAQLLR